VIIEAPSESNFGPPLFYLGKGEKRGGKRRRRCMGANAIPSHPNQSLGRKKKKGKEEGRKRNEVVR